MFCYHDTLTKSNGGGALAGYYAEVLSGNTVVLIYADNSATPIASVSGVANRAKTDANGNFSFYVADGTYSIKYYDTNGVYTGVTENDIQMIGTDSIAAAAASAAAAAGSASSSASSASASASSAATAAAYTSAKSANTAALISAIRTNGFFPLPSYRLAANDTPTITVPSGGAASVINGQPSFNANVSVATTSKITWIGGAAETDVNVTYASRGPRGAPSRSPQYTSFEFLHTGTALEVQLFCTQLSGGVFNFRVLVNDKIAGTALVPGDGSNRLVHLSFPVSGTRRIRIEMAGGRCRGLNVSATSEVTSTGRTYPLVTVLGDSFAEGTGASSTIDGEGVSPFRALGLNPALAAVGGTGILNPGSGGKVNWQDAERLSDLAMNGFTDKITSASPNVAMGVIKMSINDGQLNDTFWGGAANYQEAMRKGLLVLIDHWMTNRPGKPLVVIGGTSPSTTATNLDGYRMRDAAQEAIMGLGGAANNLWFIDRLGAGPLLRSGSIARVTLTGTLTSGSKVITGLSSTASITTGASVSGTGIASGARVQSIDSGTQVTIDIAATASGAQSLLFSTDQSALYTTSGDTTHPNQQGHNYDSLWMANELRNLILTQFN